MTEPSAEYREILSRLNAIQNGKPIIDPTANVLSLVSAAITRQDDLRTLAERFTEKLFAERRIADSEAKHAEAGRIDALLVANTNNVALALEKQGAQAQAQDKRIAALEQNQYQGVGGKMQQVEGQQRSQWTMDKLLMLAIAAIGWILLLLRSK